MKKSLLLLLTTLILSCNNDPRSDLPKQGYFGENFTPDSVITVPEALAMANNGDTSIVIVKGTISNYCKGEGCWMTLKNEGGEDLLITVKDKAFVLPKGIEQKSAVTKGTLKKEKDEEGKETLLIEASGILIE